MPRISDTGLLTELATRTVIPSMIRQQVRVDLNSIKAKIARDGKFETKAGIIRRRLGRAGPSRISSSKPGNC